MQTFHYRAKTATAVQTEGTLQAETRQAALTELESKGLFPLELTHREEARAAVQATRWFGRVGRKDVTAFSRQLSDLLSAGINLDGALDILIREASRPQVEELITEIKGTVGGGAALSEALAGRKEQFGDLFVNMVAAGEEGGFLAEALDRVAAFQEKRDALASKVKEALVYPAILCTLGTATVIYLLVFFIPKFATMFADMNATLPAPTQMLLALSTFLANWWHFLLIVIAGGTILLSRSLRTDAGRLMRDQFLLKVPLVKAITSQTALARLSRTLGTLLASGVPMLRSLQIAGRASGNGVYEAAVERVSKQVSEGSKIGESMLSEPLFPPSYRGRVGIGEESGSLDTILVNIADGYEAAVDRAVKAFVTAFEPLLITLLAGVIGFIVVAMLLPIFTLAKTIRTH